MVKYARHNRSHYVDQDGKPTGTADDINVTLGNLKRLFGPTPLADFGPPQLKTVRQAMVDDGRVREQVNKRTSQLRQFFRWCVEEQLVSPTVLLGLQAVRALDRGRSGVKEGSPRQPADPVAVEKALPFMPPAVRAVVQILRLTGARPSEVLLLTPGELDRTGDVWIPSPTRHKTSWRGKDRRVFLGPEARAVLAPWLDGIGPDQHVFSPWRSEAMRNQERSLMRVTPRWLSHMARNKQKRRRGRKRLSSDCYDRQSLGHAIRRACQRAGVTAFCPYSLRHLRAAELRAKYGLETVRAVLGHSYKAMADHYSRSADATLANRAAVETG